MAQVTVLDPQDCSLLWVPIASHELCSVSEQRALIREPHPPPLLRLRLVVETDHRTREHTCTYRLTAKTERNGLTGVLGKARQMERAKFVPWLGFPPSSISQCLACGSSPTQALALYRDLLRQPSLASHGRW